MAKHDFYLNLTDKKGRKDLFASINNVREFLFLKLTMLELLYSQWNGEHTNENCTFPYLHVDDKKMHRVFIVSNNKIVSFSFGMTIQEKGNKILVFHQGQKEFTAKHISEARSILEQLDERSLYNDLSDDDLEQTPSYEGKWLFEYLLFEEPAYLRYDFDKVASRGKRWILHPKYHFDINFSPNFTYKLGLVREIEEMEFNKILSAEEFCRRISLKGSRLNRGINSNRNSNLKYLRLAKRNKSS